MTSETKDTSKKIDVMSYNNCNFVTMLFCVYFSGMMNVSLIFLNFLWCFLFIVPIEELKSAMFKGLVNESY